jgi:hypothetical protein
MPRLLLCVLIVTASACSWIPVARTPGETTSGFGYIPLDGLAVNHTLGDASCKNWAETSRIPDKTRRFSTLMDLAGPVAGEDPFVPLLQALPDISVRYAVGSFDGKGNLSFGPVQITTRGSYYRAILDYVNVDSIPVTFSIKAIRDGRPISINELNSRNLLPDHYEVSRVDQGSIAPRKFHDDNGAMLVTIPVYVGIGMRIQADITAIEGNVPLTSLGVIGLEAQARKLSGTLTVQTIGISGEPAATSLPLPGRLDQTSVENAILALGSNRAVVYRSRANDNGIVITPRVVGLYSPIGSNPSLINAIYSELSRNRPNWDRPCRPIPAALRPSAAKSN